MATSIIRYFDRFGRTKVEFSVLCSNAPEGFDFKKARDEIDGLEGALNDESGTGCHWYWE